MFLEAKYNITNSSRQIVVYGPVCHPQNIILISASLQSIYYFVHDILVHKLPYDPQYHELFVKYINVPSPCINTNNI
jgi:hypothetical protein